MKAPLLTRIAELLHAMRPGSFLRIAIDGVDGVGKTRFADDLAPVLQAMGRPTLRASIDGFHHPRAWRYRRGRGSPEGFYRDSHDLDALWRCLLRPLGPGGTGLVCLAVFDHVADQPLSAAELRAAPGSVLLLDGIFLHRPELRDAWDLSIFLDAPFAITVPRGAARGEGWGSPDPDAASNRRYIEGQRLYFREAAPQAQASIVIDHRDLAAPRITAWPKSLPARPARG